MSIKKNTTYNLVGAVLPIAVSLVTIPAYIRLVGEARYGILAIVWAFLGYFGLFDLGLGAATAQRVAALGDSRADEVASTCWTALAMNAALGVFGGLMIWPASLFFFGRVFNIEAALRSELFAALPWLILAVPVATVSGVLGGALQGRSRFLELNVVSVAGVVLLQTIPLFVAWAHGPDLAWLVPSVILARMLSICMLAWQCKLHVTGDRRPLFSRDQARGLLSFGGWVTVTSIVGPLMVVLDRFVIGATIGAKAVAYYTVPFQLADRSTILPAALTSALFPRLAAAEGAKGRKLATQAIQSLAVVMTPLMLAAILLVEPFLQFWIGSDFAAHANEAAQVLMFGFWINGLARVPYVQLYATGRPRINAIFHLVELPPYLAALLWGLHYWGLPGASVAFALRVFADWLLLSLAARTLRTSALMLAAPAVFLGAGMAVSMGLGSESLLRWAASCSLLLAALLWSWLSAPADLRDYATRLAMRLPQAQ